MRSSRCPGAVPGPVRVGDEVGHERALQPLDLAVEQLGLLDVRLGLELPEGVELGDVLHVVLLQEPGDGVLGGHAPLDEPEPSAEHVAERTHLVGDHVGFGQEIGPQKMGQHGRVGAIGLDLGRGDGLDALGVGESEVDVSVECVLDPVPAGGALDGRGVASGLLGEVGQERRRSAGHLGGRHDGASGVDGGGGDGAFVEVEAGEVGRGHGSGGEWGLKEGILIGNIPPLQADPKRQRSWRWPDLGVSSASPHRRAVSLGRLSVQLLSSGAHAHRAAARATGDGLGFFVGVGQLGASVADRAHHAPARGRVGVLSPMPPGVDHVPHGVIPAPPPHRVGAAG